MWSISVPASLALLCAPVVLGADVQLSSLTVPAQYASQTDTVKQIFTYSYDSYKCVLSFFRLWMCGVEKVRFDSRFDVESMFREFAYGHDEVEPVSESYTDPRNGWGESTSRVSMSLTLG